MNSLKMNADCAVMETVKKAEAHNEKMEKTQKVKIEKDEKMELQHGEQNLNYLQNVPCKKDAACDAKKAVHL